jgi:broad specificity phosphatase PhoE
VSSQGGAAGEVWLLRHGETEWSKANKHTSRTDIDLTAHGEEQARALGKLLGGLRPAVVLVSPRRRAQRTVELAGLVPYEVDDRLVEWYYGRYEGLTTAEIHRERPNWTIWSGDPPGGETAAEVGARVDAVLARIRAALPLGDVLVVAHGHVGRVIAARWLGLPVQGGRYFMLGPAAPSVLSAEHEIPAIRRWNAPNPVDGGLR